MSTVKFEGFEPANTTPVPDVLFDVLLPHLNEAQLKVLLYIVRRTLGFKKTVDAISLKQFRYGITTKKGEQLDNGCGLKNFTSIINALKVLEEMGCIESEKKETTSGDQATTVYRILFRGTARNGVPTASNGVGVLRETEHGTASNGVGVLRQTESQETVLQQTVKQQTVNKRGKGAQSSSPNEKPSSSSLSFQEKNAEKEISTQTPTTEQAIKPPKKKETAARKTAIVEKTITLSPGAQKVYEEWCKMPWFKVKPELTETLAAHCEVAKHYKPTAEIMLKVKNDATSAKNDKKGFYKGKGWNFKFMLNELPQWLAMNDPACNGGSPSTPPSSQQTTQDDEQKLVAWTRTGQWDGNPLENWQQFELMTKKEAKILGWTSDALPGVIHNKIMIQLRKQADQQHRQQATA